MSKQDNLTDFLTDVADAIREKKGTAEKINPQDFSGEIKNLPSGGSSPFTVDFGEEIASGNPYTLDSLTDDIAYYNQIQEERRLYAEGKGGRSDTAILADPEFQEKIAWWPKGMAKPVSNNMGNFYGLIEFVDDSFKPTFYTGSFGNCVRLKRVKADYSGITRLYQGFRECASLEEVDADLTSVENAQYAFYNCKNIGRGVFDLDMPNVTEGGSLLSGSFVRKAVIRSKVLTNAGMMFMSCSELNEVHIDISSKPNITSIFSGCWKLAKVYVKGWTTGSLGINLYSTVLPESIHYIIQNANGTEARTLGLQAVVKANWEASEYYAEDLVKAQELNITIA